MRSTAKWVLPVLVGPRTAKSREDSPRGEESFMALKAADASARRKPPRAASGTIAWVTPAADASKAQIATIDAAVKKRGVNADAANSKTRAATRLLRQAERRPEWRSQAQEPAERLGRSSQNQRSVA